MVRWAVGLGALLLTLKPVLLLALQVTFSPEKLCVEEGSPASFFCNISTGSFPNSDYSLNWYKKINSSYNQKIAELTNGKQIPQDNFSLHNHSSAVEIRFRNLTKSDSGDYYCGLIIFSSSRKVLESSVSQLTVEALQGNPTGTAAPDRTKDRTKDRSEDDDGAGDSNMLLIVIPSVAGAMLLGLVAYMVTHRLRGQQKAQSENAPLEDQAPGMRVYAVDYGVLEFQQEALKAPVGSPTSDHTEYAIIVFPEEKPVTPERGKRSKSPSPQPQTC